MRADAEHAAIPVIRDTIVHEHADGDLVVRLLIDTDDVDTFWRSFPESNEAVFLCDGAGAIEAIRGPLMREYKDGGLAVKLLVNPAQKRLFRTLWPRPGMAAVLVREDPESGRQRMIDAAAAASPPAKFGELARALRTSGFMLSRDVWRAVGPDSAYLGYIRQLKCAKCKWTPHWENDAFVPCEAAHVRRIESGAGTSLKPDYSAIPLCPNRIGVEGCHARQHREGERFLGSKEHLDRLRLHYVQDWVWAALKAQLGYEHWSQVPPSTLVAWAEEHGVVDKIPDVYFREI